ncbi:unnamed protein product [Owenia fusiformis]|uniref:Uncharacterized protein n=1 Tax=Owenia fusiformis TaxID=6347 RepID=A0A8S4N263_OWEFU|nr:unnamed protein product [Owenia fusiformis]
MGISIAGRRRSSTVTIFFISLKAPLLNMSSLLADVSGRELACDIQGLDSRREQYAHQHANTLTWVIIHIAEIIRTLLRELHHGKYFDLIRKGFRVSSFEEGTTICSIAFKVP